eukprot:TRINITY_DN20876_c0_g3_i1.p1 TRINITY_DN20876_c0_g3~~TRINITY_DN20876_c0_g3_i1.p1  ORF type:complete len:259 (+),score=127.89 TRINITY_DN20876_c0_g3_i1:61-837(+)
MSARKPFVGGNFKCTGTAASLTTLVKAFNGSIADTDPARAEVVIAPSALYLCMVKGLVRGHVKVAAQNCIVKSGAFTGEYSAEQVRDVGLDYVILGHSERRSIYKEADATIRAKTEAALAHNLTVIFCIGETLQEREAGKTEEVCTRQLQEGLRGLPQSAFDRIVIAYEPVWAIGTGKVASPEQAQEMCLKSRQVLASLAGTTVSRKVRIIYGGSVNPKNAASLWAKPDIDGFLVGGASTKPEFSEIVNTVLHPKAKL